MCKTATLKKTKKNGFQHQLFLNAGQKYCRMFQGEHSAILSTFIKLPFVIMIFVLSIFEWPFYTGFTVVKVHKAERIKLKMCIAICHHHKFWNVHAKKKLCPQNEETWQI